MLPSIQQDNPDDGVRDGEEEKEREASRAIYCLKDIMSYRKCMIGKKIAKCLVI